MNLVRLPRSGLALHLGRDPLKTYLSCLRGAIIRYADVTPRIIVFAISLGPTKKEEERKKGATRTGARKVMP